MLTSELWTSYIPSISLVYLTFFPVSILVFCIEVLHISYFIYSEDFNILYLYIFSIASFQISFIESICLCCLNAIKYSFWLYILMSSDEFTHPYNLHHNQDKIYSSPQIVPLCPYVIQPIPAPGKHLCAFQYWNLNLYLLRFCIDGIIHNMHFYFCLISLSFADLEIHPCLFVYISCPFLFITEYYSIILLSHNSSIHLLVDISVFVLFCFFSLGLYKYCFWTFDHMFCQRHMFLGK